jgi:murein endopeptidase
MLSMPGAKVGNKRLHPEGPAYQVLAFEGDSFASRIAVITLPAAEKVLELAKGGLPILLIGDWSAARGFGVCFLSN